MLCGISIPFGMLSPSWRQVTHALLTRPPLSFFNFIPKESVKKFSLDLHVLGTPPAFVLSQDQTLEINSENWLAQFWILTLSLLYCKVLWNWQGPKTLCNCRNSTFVLITAFSLCTFQTSLLATFKIALSSDSLSILTRFRLFVNTFFELFLNFF